MNEERARRVREYNRIRLRRKRRTDAAFNKSQAAGQRARRLRPEVRAAEQARRAVRRARQISQGERMPSRDAGELLELARWLTIINRDPCSYCQRLHDRMQVDHIVALIRDPDWRWTNSTAACPTCNPAKRDRPWWAAYGMLSSRRQEGSPIRRPCRQRAANRRGRARCDDQSDS